MMARWLRHELRTPINAIIGYSEMLLEDTLADGEASASLRAHLEAVHSAGRRLLALVNGDEIGLARETAGADYYQAFRALIDTVLCHTAALLASAGEHGPAAMAGDLLRIQAAGKQLSTLGEDFIKPGKSWAVDADPGEVPSSAAPELEENLASVSSPGAGGQQWETGKGLLLVVDDNALNRDLLSRYLQNLGYAVVLAENGRQALDLLPTRRFDLVLLDLLMPELDGYEVLQRMKAAESWRDLPVIIVSALDELSSVVKCIELGAEDYLPKPFNPVLLRARLNACLQKKWFRDKEVEYLRQVERVTRAAATVEAGTFEPESLNEVAARNDALGQLARVFQRMGLEVAAREKRLRQQVQALQIEIDRSGTARQIAEITETDYFQHLRQLVDKLRDTEGQEDKS